MILADSGLMVAQNIGFAVIAFMIVGAAIRVVTTDNVMHAALYLVMVLAGVAAQYILLAAEFIAIVQVIVYIGAIVVLFLFGIMLTEAKLGKSDDLDNKPMRPVAIAVAVALLGLLAYSLVDYYGDDQLALAGQTTAELGQTTAQVADSVFITYLIPFEVVGVLLLVALTGAIVLARRD
ncbi:MAG: NADH-quinone oxidoreductase subunit J [Acidimicrobiia bacterium]|nr:NADH-quinone oxidoreductase subunit J [Acidimicrobiia bacterium]